jgi:hypothetical protein
MLEVVTLELPPNLAQKAREIATLTHKPLETVLLEWLDHALTDLPVESLPDAQVLSLCELQLEPDQQTRLDSYLAQQREEQLSLEDQQQLNDLMQIYRQGLVRKAKALKVAVERGLHSSLSA